MGFGRMEELHLILQHRLLVRTERWNEKPSGVLIHILENLFNLIWHTSPNSAAETFKSTTDQFN